MALYLPSGPAIARYYVDLVDPRALCELPGESVLTATIADEENAESGRHCATVCSVVYCWCSGL